MGLKAGGWEGPGLCLEDGRKSMGEKWSRKGKVRW